MADDRLPPCPGSPNCVSSDAPAADTHHIEPFALNAPPADAWAALLRLLENTPRAAIVEHTPARIHAEFKIFFFGFVDDVEFHLRPASGIIAVRSASRVGHSDLGVNRRRVEGLRRRLRDTGVIR